VGIRYLGPLEVEDAGSAVPVPGSRLRQLLVRLALAPGSWVPAGTLADAVWADGAPADRANSLQSLVSRLRRVLGRPELVEQSAAGYHLAVPPEAVDAVRFAGRVTRHGGARPRRLRTAADPHRPGRRRAAPSPDRVVRFPAYRENRVAGRGRGCRSRVVGWCG
jgi:DNA-binding SARP family transcriptional activator